MAIRAVLAILFMGASSCTPSDTAVTPGAPAAVPDEPVQRIPLAPVQVFFPQITGRRSSERAGVVAALLELGLGDLPGVVPSVNDGPVSPGLIDALPDPVTPWTLNIELSTDPWGLMVQFCPLDGTCSLLRTTAGTPLHPEAAVAQILIVVADALSRNPSEAARAAWSDPLVGDDYALLVSGRAASGYYGLTERISADVIGDSRRDPVLHAIRINPGIVVTAWIGARREAERGRALLSGQLMLRARQSRPSSVLLKADVAALTDTWGQPRTALALWDDVASESDSDQRFAIGRARTAMHAGDAEAAFESLRRLPRKTQHSAIVAELLVHAAEATDRAEVYDELLSIWQDASPADPEPVRRRVRLRVRNGQYADALTLTPELAKRGQTDEASRSELALLAALGHFDQAAERATALNDPLTAGRLRARAEDRALPHLIDDNALPARRWMARTLLQAGDPQAALTVADTMLRQSVSDPYALVLRADALDALGRSADAARARVQASSSLRYGVVVVPSTAAGSAR